MGYPTPFFSLFSHIKPLKGRFPYLAPYCGKWRMPGHVIYDLINRCDPKSYKRAVLALSKHLASNHRGVHIYVAVLLRYFN